MNGSEKIISFASTIQLMKASFLLEEAGIATFIIPNPRCVEITCGNSLVVDNSVLPMVFSILDANNVIWSKLIETDSNFKNYTVINHFCEK